MRRFAVPFALMLAVVMPAWPAPSRAHAQSESTVALKLLSMRPLHGPQMPLKLAFQATNLSGEALEGLVVGLAIDPRTHSRSEYALSLEEPAPYPLLAKSFPQEDASLEPGQSREFVIEQPLQVLTALGASSGLYPVGVYLRSGEAVVGTLRLPMIFLTEPPKVPLSFAWTWILSEPVQFGPDGVFYPGPLQRAVAPGGRLHAMVESLLGLKRSTTPVDVGVSPVLLQQLARMAGGFQVRGHDGAVTTVRKGTGRARMATDLLADLRSLVKGGVVELVALPYGDASLPVLIQSRLGKRFPTLLERGREEVGQALGRPGTREVFRPPFSQIDPLSLSRIAGVGVRTVLVDAGVVPHPRDAFPSPAPVVALTGRGRSVTAVVPDAAFAGIASAYQDDPRLAAHAALGQLAAIYFEYPSIGGRGAAVLFPERPLYSGEFLRAFSGLVRGSPWLRPRHASDLVSHTPDPEPRAAPDRAYPGFPAFYVERLNQARRALGRLTDAVPDAEQVVGRLEDQLLLANSSSFVANPRLGSSFISSVSNAVRATFARIRLDDNAPRVTLTSQRGLIPVRVTNETGYRVHARIRLAADRSLVFTDENPQEIMLPEGTQTFFVRGRAETTGQFPVNVLIETPGGGRISSTRMVVRSRAYNRIALFLTIGAALFLMLWWGRRFLPRPRS